jgi:hypothetical protein
MGFPQQLKPPLIRSPWGAAGIRALSTPAPRKTVAERIAISFATF